MKIITFFLFYCSSSLVLGMYCQPTTLLELVKSQNYFSPSVVKSWCEYHEKPMPEGFNKQDENGETGLHWLAKRFMGQAALDYILYEKKLGDEVINVQNNAGETPLFVAIKFEQIENMVALSGVLGCDIYKENREGFSPLFYLILKQDDVMLKKFLELCKPCLKAQGNLKENNEFIEVTPHKFIEFLRQYQRKEHNGGKLPGGNCFNDLHELLSKIDVDNEKLNKIEALLDNYKY